MAVKTFQEIWDSLSADQKTLLDNTFKVAPELKEGWLRQDDYSRKSNELKAEKDKMAEDLEYAERMKGWGEKIMPRIEALRTAGVLDDEDNEVWTAQKADLEKQLAEARKAAVGGDMDPAELDKRVREIVKANGSLTKEELNAVIKEEGQKLAKETFAEEWKVKETDFNSKTIPMVAGFSAANTLAAIEYEKVTGKPWTREVQQEFFGFMGKENNFDPFVARDKFLEPAKAAKVAADAAAVETQKKIDEAVAADRKARGVHVENGETFIPQPDQKGNIALMLERSKDSGTDFESLIAAQTVLAAKELQQEGK